MRLIVGNIYQGRTEYARATYGEDIKLLKDLPEIIRELINQNMSENDIIKTVLSKAETFDVVIAEEGYSGLTPMDKKERRFTEVYGRVLGEIAKASEGVERVVCGLAITLK